MNSSNPFVSVVIPTYKRNDFLKKAIESAGNQTYANTEIIIVDDNEPDSLYRRDTVLLVHSMSHKYSNIRYIAHEQNKGGSAARNTGIKESQGMYVSFLDDDDWWLTGKLSLQLIKMKDNVGILSEAINKKNNIYQDEYLNKDMLIKYRWPGGTTSSLLIRKNIIAKYLFDESLVCGQEFDLLLRLAQGNEKIICTADQLVYINVSESYDRITTAKMKISKNDVLNRTQAIEKNKEYIGKHYNLLLARNILGYFHRTNYPFYLIFLSTRKAGMKATIHVLILKLLDKISFIKHFTYIS